MRAMKTISKLLPLLAAALLGVAILAAPAAAADLGDTADEVVEQAVTETDAEDGEGGRPALAETPEDRFGLLLLGALGAAAVFGWIGMRRQLGGKHPQASGEFRWR